MRISFNRHEHESRRRAPDPRHAFALDAGLCYLNHAAIGVLPIRARDALIEYAHAHAQRGVIGVATYEMRLPAARKRLATFLGGDAFGVAFVRNTSEAANILARGLALQAGDEVFTNDNEFGSNVYPWQALNEAGVTLRLLSTAHERLTPDVLAREIRPATKVVAVSWVSFMDGYRHDLAALADIAHRNGALFVVDAIQGLGAAPFDMRALTIDAVYGGAQKWLLAEPGLGFLCVTPDLLDRMSVHTPGWRSVEDIWNFLQYDQPWAPDATRFEGGTPNLAGITALMETLDLLESSDLAAVDRHILNLTAYLRAGLREQGAVIAGSTDPAAASGIVTFTLPQCDPLKIGQDLASANICVTSRTTGIRVSPHGYNTIAEIEQLIGVIRPILKM